MAVPLLDLNVLLALAWPNHLHHQAAHRWFGAQREKGWATCPLTQLGFVRLSSQPQVVKMTIAVSEALRVLEANLSSRDHEFWPLECGLLQILPEIRERLMGHHQLADALLLDLAIRRGGRLATFDRRVEGLLPGTSPHRAALEVLTI